MKSKTTAAIVTFLTFLSMGTAVLVAQPANALTCTVLPKSVCDLAQKKDSGGDVNSSNSAVLALLQWVIGILTGGVGVAAVAAFIYAGIMYSSADGSAEQVKNAKNIMQNTVIGLVVFAVMAIAIEWLIPGGVF